MNLFLTQPLHRIIKNQDMKNQLFLFVVMMALATTVAAQSNTVGVTRNEPDTNPQTDSIKTRQTVGVAIDLLPTIMSAATGSFGYSGQLWYGYNKFRVRGLIAKFQMPDKLMGNADYKNLKTTATAVIIDYFKDYNFEGWWLGAGVEMWNNTITSKSDNNNYHFNDYVATAGCGYIFKVYSNFYIEPWGAVHYVLSNEQVVVDATSYSTKKFQGELSLKVGWHF